MSRLSCTKSPNRCSEGVSKISRFISTSNIECKTTRRHLFKQPLLSSNAQSDKQHHQVPKLGGLVQKLIEPGIPRLVVRSITAHPRQGNDRRRPFHVFSPF